MLTVLRRQSRRLRALVQQFLDFSRLEAQRPLAVDLQPTDVVDVIERVVELFDHQHDLILGAEAGLTRAIADGSRLEQVLTNLVANAVKFSDRPVRVVARRSGEHVLIEVIDEGEGIPEGDLERVFEKFYRGHDAGRTSGSGLGLYVARALTEAQGGQLSVASTVGVGTRFRILLERENPT
jgi:signal transduction histidine kinase